MFGQKPYRLHASSDVTLEIEGVVEAPELLWQPSAFNLVGFTLDPVAPPGFPQFFSESKAHVDIVVCRLSGGTWRKVLNPESEQMRSGEAFWIYCDGAWSQTLPTMESGTALRVPLALQRDSMTVLSEAYPLLCIKTDVGTETWLPVLGSREDLK